MGQTVGFSVGVVALQREEGALSDEVRGGVVLVQLCEDGSERLARVQFLGRRRVPGVHIHHKMRVCSKESHLAFRITTIRAVSVSLNEFPDSKAICGFFRGNSYMFAHPLFSFSIGSGKAKSVTRGWPSVRETPRFHTCRIRDQRLRT